MIPATEIAAGGAGLAEKDGAVGDAKEYGFQKHESSERERRRAMEREK